MRRFIVFAVLGSLMGSGCWFGGDDDGLGSMTLRVDAGSARVVRGERSIPVDDRFALDEGDIVETSGDGAATVRLGGGREATVGPGTRIGIVDDTALRLGTGRLLAAADEGMTVSFGGARLSGAGAVFRVDRGFAVRAGVYSGAAELVLPGRPPARIGELFEATTAGGRFTGVRPYQLDHRDLWDQRFLDDALALDEALTRFGSGLEPQIGRKRPGVGFFEALASGGPAGFVRPELASRPVAELLIAFSIAHSAPGSPAGSFRRAFELRDDNGSWGIVAEILDARRRKLLARLDEAVDGIGLLARGTGRTPTFRVAAGAAAPRLAPDPGSEREGERLRRRRGPDRKRRPREQQPEPEPEPTDDGCDSLTECVLDIIPLRLSTGLGG